MKLINGLVWRSVQEQDSSTESPVYAVISFTSLFPSNLQPVETHQSEMFIPKPVFNHKLFY
ncbi:hypothetical protein AMELA_G00016750, partial [Ameiurus melas]